MTYTLLYTKSAQKDIQKLDIIAKKKIRKKLEQLAMNPTKLAKKLHNSSLGSYRLRVGNYRIIFDLQGNDIIILRAGHRREVYK